MTGDTPDPGYRDPDRSAAFQTLLANLDHFDATPYIRKARREMYRLLRPRPGSVLLDAGCGTGSDVAALAAKVTPGGRVIGMDVSSRFLGVARGRYGQVESVEFVQGSIDAIDFPKRRSTACARCAPCSTSTRR